MIPDIHILQLVDGARRASGLTVVIDVCRAFSTAAFLVSRGAEEIYPVGTLEEAFQLRERLPACALAGEVKGQKPDGFDFGNSPSEILRSSGVPKSMIQRTSAGTQGIVNARGADEIVAGAFVNAAAIVRYIKQRKPKTVSLVCMGWEAQRECEEDALCAEFLRGRISGQELNFSELAERIERSETGDKFRDTAYPWMPYEDLGLCLSLDRFDFVLRCDSRSAMPLLRRLDV